MDKTTFDFISLLVVILSTSLSNSILYIIAYFLDMCKSYRKNIYSRYEKS